jgi:hypothetical protein
MSSLRAVLNLPGTKNKTNALQTSTAFNQRYQILHFGDNVSLG